MPTTLIDNWMKAKAAFVTAQNFERQLRAQVIAANSGVGEMHSGVENVPVLGGTLKIEHKLDYKLDNDNDKIDAVLDAIEVSMEGGKIIAERLIKWTPEISVREYKLLEPAQKKLVDDVLTIKPASKSIEFKPNAA